MMYIVCTVSAPARDIQIIFGTVCQTSGPSIGRQIWTNTFVSAPARRYSDYFWYVQCSGKFILYLLTCLSTLFGV